MLDFEKVTHPDIDLVERCLVQDDYAGLCRALGNTLEYSAFLLNPQVRTLKESLVAQGADGVLMSGSGSTVFAIGRDHRAAVRMEGTLSQDGLFCPAGKAQGIEEERYGMDHTNQGILSSQAGWLYL